MNDQSVRRFHLLDLARFYCACLVIFIHMGLDGHTPFISCVTRQAVPFFFLVSGFFFDRNLSRSKDGKTFTVKYVTNILLIYAVWMLLWLPYFVQDAFAQHGDRSALYVVLVILRRLVLAGAAPYWYLLVLAEGALLLSLVLRHKLFRLGWILCILGLALRIVFDLQLEAGLGALIHKAFYSVFSWNCNVVMTGFPLLFLGAFCSRHEELLRPLRRVVVGILYVGSILLAFYVYESSDKLYGIPFGIIQALLLFLFCILPSDIESRIPGSVCKVSRSLSSVIFLTHTVFLMLLANLFHIWGVFPRFVLCVLLAIVILFLTEKINWRPLKRLLMVK